MKLDPRLAARILAALPFPTLLVDRELTVSQANEAARRILGAEGGSSLGQALGCIEAGQGRCGAASRCADCAFRRAVDRAQAGQIARARGFVLRTGAKGEPNDLHLLAHASPLEHEGVVHALLVLQDVNEILADPGVLRVCIGCGRVEDEEGAWHPLHRYLEDRLGLTTTEELCTTCARRAGPAGGFG